MTRFYLVLTRTPTGRWRWSARGLNHEKLAQGQPYRNRTDMLATLELMFGGKIIFGEKGQTGTLWREADPGSIPIEVQS